MFGLTVAASHHSVSHNTQTVETAATACFATERSESSNLSTECRSLFDVDCAKINWFLFYNTECLSVTKNAVLAAHTDMLCLLCVGTVLGTSQVIVEVSVPNCF